MMYNALQLGAVPDQSPSWRTTMGRGTTIVLTEEERAPLLSWIRSGTTQQRLVPRARLVLAAADGKETQDIAKELGMWAPAVQRDSCDPGQSQHAQAETRRLTVAAQQRPLSLHAHARVVAESDRDVVQHPEPGRSQRCKLHLGPAGQRSHRSVHRGLQSESRTFRMDQEGGAPVTAQASLLGVTHVSTSP